MILRELHATFGTLENRSLSLGDGLNILEGPNESGKSTWCAFIRAMLYGIPSSERDTKTTIAAKNRFRPWSGSPMSGTMKLSCPLGELTLERKGTPASPMKDLFAYGASGDVIRLPESAAGETLLGIGSETFERSAFIERAELPTGSGGELERRILSLVSSGEEDSSFTEAENRLKEWQRKLKYNKRGEIPELEDRIVRLHIAANAAASKADELAVKSAALRDLEAKLAALQDEQEVRIAWEKAAAAEHLRAAEARLVAAENDVVETRKRLPPGNATSEELRRLERELVAAADRRLSSEAMSFLLAEKRRQAEQTEQQTKLFKPFDGCPPEQAQSLVAEDAAVLAAMTPKAEAVKVLRRIFPLFLLPIPAAAALILLLPLQYAIPAALVFAAAVVFTVIRIAKSAAAARIRRHRQTIREKYAITDVSELNQTLEAYTRLHAILEQQRSQEAELRIKIESMSPMPPYLLNRLFEIYPAFHTLAELEAGISSATSAAVAAIEKYSHAIMLRNSAQSVVDGLRSSVGTSEYMPAPRKPSMGKEELEAALQQTVQSLAILRRETALLEGSMEHEKTPDALSAESAALTVRLEELNRDYDAITIALSQLTEADRQLRERFSPMLNTAAAEIFTAFTGKKYKHVVISREFTAMAGSGGSTGLRRALELSRGTVDQLYLAVRLAVCKIVPSPDNPVPVILDDAFLAFDDDRLKAALDWLYEESKSRQILLFTCHQRESAYLAGRSGVKVQTVTAI